MRAGSNLYRFLAWLALCGLILSAVAPPISKILATSQGIEWTEICSSEGTKLVALETGTSKPSDVPMVSDSYCGYCLLYQHSPIAPVLAFGSVSMALVLANYLTVYNPGRTLFKRLVREAHRTRAPPAIF